MITEAEQRYLYWLTSERYTGQGSIVEVGPWLGRSTLHLAAGLEASGHPGHITSIDHFTWVGADYEVKHQLDLAKGDDFQSYFERNVAPFRNRIRPVKSKIQKFAWRDGWIEILFVDAPKQTGAISSLLAGFAPSLMPGATLVFQDYVHGPSYQLAIAISKLDRFLQPVQVVLPGCTVAFEIKHPIYPEDVTEEALGVERMSEAEAKARWQEIVEPLPETAADQMAVGLPMLLYDLGYVEAACVALAEIADRPETASRLKRWSTTNLAPQYLELFVSAGFQLPKRRMMATRWQQLKLPRRIRKASRRLRRWFGFREDFTKNSSQPKQSGLKP